MGVRCRQAGRWILIPPSRAGPGRLGRPGHQPPPAAAGGPAAQAALVQKVIDAAYTAFHDGLRDALFLSAALVLSAGLLAVVTLRARPTHHRGHG